MDHSELTTERLTIRPVMEQDAADIFEIRGDRDTAEWASVPRMESIEDALDYVSESGRSFSIVLGDEVVGLLEIYSGVEMFSSDFLGYYMKKSHRGKGYMTEALLALRDKWLEEDSRIPMLWIFPDNDASNRVAKKCGWTCLGARLVDIDGSNQFVYFYA